MSVVADDRSRILEMGQYKTLFEEHAEYYNLDRRHSSTLQQPPAHYLDQLLTGADPVTALSAASAVN